MPALETLMKALEKLVQWATERGIILHGIAPRPIQGRGTGFVATRSTKVVKGEGFRRA